MGRELEELLVDEGVVDADAVRSAAEAASGEERALAEVLVEEAGVPEDVLADLVARSLGSVVIDVELGALDTEAVRLVPEAIARRHLLIPVAQGPAGESLRVAFANPLDAEAIEAVREQTGLAVDPLVATVSGVRTAIDREYQGRDTRVIRAPRGRSSEIAEESTRRVALPEARGGERGRGPVTTDSDLPLPSGGTAPVHRLEQDATPEQRHEALLLALVDAGVLTRSDYLAALKRLMGKR